MPYKVELLSKNSTQLGEGPHWDEVNNRLLLIDIERSTIHRWDYATSKLLDPIVLEDSSIGAVVPRAKGGLVAAASHRFASIDESTGKVETIVKATENKQCRFNDGKCDPKGRFWAGTMGLESSPAVPIPSQGELFVLDTDHSCSKKLDKIEISNGLAWSADNTKMFYIDSLKSDVSVFDYDNETAAICNRRSVVTFSEGEHGIPDGQCIDADGNLWVAMFRGPGILKVDPVRGEIVETIKVSTTAIKTTSCCFGGPNFDELFVTSAINKEFEFNKGLPVGDSGSLFKVTGLGVKGLPGMPFKG